MSTPIISTESVFINSGNQGQPTSAPSAGITSIEVLVISDLQLDPSIAQEDGFIEFFCAEDTSTVIPFKSGDFDATGKSNASFQQKIKSKVLYLNEVQTSPHAYFGVTQSKQKLRDTLGTISSVLTNIGSLIPPQFAPVSGVTQILSALLQFIKVESPDVTQAAKFLAVPTGALSVGALGGGKSLLNMTVQSKTITAEKYINPAEYRVVISNLNFATIGGNVSLPTPTTINTTKGPRLTVGSGSSSIDVADWIENVIGTMTCECQSPLAGKPQTYHVPVQGTLQASWESFEVLRVKAPQGFIPISIAFSMSPKGLNLAAYGDVVSSVLNSAPKFGTKVPSGISKAVQPAFATLAGLFSDSLELFHFNGAIALDNATGIDASLQSWILTPKNGAIAVSQPVYGNGQKVGTFSCSISVEKISATGAPGATSVGSATALLQSQAPATLEPPPAEASPLALEEPRLIAMPVSPERSGILAARPANVPSVVDVYGPDYANDPYDWSAVAGSGVVGVIHKCTDGIVAVDDKFVKARQQIKAAGLLLGAYHFARPGKPEQQAAHFLDQAKLQKGDISAIDVEPRNEAMGPKDCMALADVVVWARIVEKVTGRKPLIYGGGNGLRELLAVCTDKNILIYLAQCPLWLAQYADSVQVPSPWVNYTLNQYAGDYKSLPGLSQCDLNRFSGNDEDLRRWWQG